MLSVQFALHAASLALFMPSSHCSSSACTKPSPHSEIVQFKVQSAAFELAIPSSHASPICKKPSPQAGRLHHVVQTSVLTMLASSHSSPICTMPSPHPSSSQLAEHPSSSARLLSSQPSCGPTKPSPHTFSTQSSRQADIGPLAIPRSHSSMSF